MKIETNLVIELGRSSDGQFLAGAFVLNGVKQRLNIVPKGIEFEDLMRFLSLHAVAATASGKHGSISYKKSRNLE
jgi:hypothetical protein